MSNRSLNPSTLQVGDIILTADHTAVSAGIRRVTHSAYSHALLYIGHGRVIEALGDGVHSKPLHDAFDETVMSAVVLRHQDLSPVQAMHVASIALSHEGASYDVGGALVAPSQALCGTMGSTEQFFCSELIIEAFSRAGLALTGESAACSTPGDIWNATASDAVSYVGHLVSDEDKGVPPGLSWDAGPGQTAHTANEFLHQPLAQGDDDAAFLQPLAQGDDDAAFLQPLAQGDDDAAFLQPLAQGDDDAAFLQPLAQGEQTHDDDPGDFGYVPNPGDRR